jgi:hypothetical protein
MVSLPCRILSWQSGFLLFTTVRGAGPAPMKVNNFRAVLIAKP